jgi:hypothetical protein
MEKYDRRMPRIAWRQKEQAVEHGGRLSGPVVVKRWETDLGRCSARDPALTKKERDRKQASKADAKYHIDAAFPFTSIARRRGYIGRRKQ